MISRTTFNAAVFAALAAVTFAAAAQFGTLNRSPAGSTATTACAHLPEVLVIGNRTATRA